MDQIISIEAVRCRKKADARQLAEYWTDQFLGMTDDTGKFRDPDIEEEFQAWMDRQEGNSRDAG